MEVLGTNAYKLYGVLWFSLILWEKGTFAPFRVALFELYKPGTPEYAELFEDCNGLVCFLFCASGAWVYFGSYIALLDLSDREMCWTW